MCYRRIRTGVCASVPQDFAVNAGLAPRHQGRVGCPSDAPLFPRKRISAVHLRISGPKADLASLESGPQSATAQRLQSIASRLVVWPQTRKD
jgi:hypothetical protein